MVTGPPRVTPVAKPCVPAALLMVAIVVSDDDQVTALVTLPLVPSAYCPVAVNGRVWPPGTEPEFGDTVIDCSVDTSWLRAAEVLAGKLLSPP